MNRLKNIVVRFISLVSKGANKKEVIWKCDQDEKGKEPITLENVILKMDDEKQMVYGVVYSPDEEDSHGDFAKAEDIEAAAIDFMKNTRQFNVDREHSFQSEKATVVESWVVKAENGDPFVPGAKKGSWCVGIHVEDADLWGQVKKGELTGLSMAGFAVRERVSKSANEETISVLKRAKEILKSVLKLKEDNSPTEIEKEELRATRELIAKIENTMTPVDKPNRDIENLMKEVNSAMEKIEKSSVFGKRSGDVGAGGEPDDFKDYSLVIKSDAEAVTIAKGPFTAENENIGGILVPAASRKFVHFVTTDGILGEISNQPCDRLRTPVDVSNLPFLSEQIQRVPEGQRPSNFTNTSNIGKYLDPLPGNLFGQVPYRTYIDNQADPDFENKKAQDLLTLFKQDLELLAFSGIAEDYEGSAWNRLNKGWYQLASEAETSHKISVSDFTANGVVNWFELMSSVVEAMPLRYQSSELKFYMNAKDYQALVVQAGKIDGSSVHYLVEGQIPKFMGFPIRPNRFSGQSKLMFTHPRNLVFAYARDYIWRGKEVDVMARVTNFAFTLYFDYQTIIDDAIVITQ